MSLKLYRLGQWSFRNRWWVIGGWLLILAAVLGNLFLQGGAKITSAVTIDGTESERVIEELHDEFPEMSGSQGTIVFQSPDGTRLDEGETAAGLKAIADDIAGLEVMAERPDLRELLPGFDAIPKDADFDAIQEVVVALPEDVDLTQYQEMMASLPEGTDVAELQATVRTLPKGVDLAGFQQTMSTIPEGVDLSALGGMLTQLPDGVDIVQLQQSLANAPAGANPAMLAQMMPGLPEGVNIAQLQGVLAQLPPGLDIGALQALYAELPEGTDVAALQQTMNSLPQGLDVASMQTLLGDLPEDVDLAEMQSALASLGPDVDVNEMRELFAELPEGTDVSELQSVMDVPLLTVDGVQVPGVLLSEDGETAMLQVQLASAIEDLSDAELEEIIAIAQNGGADLGLNVFVSDSLKPQKAPLGGTEGLGLLVAALVLILTLGSLRAAGMPLVTALVGVGIGLGGALGLSHTIQLTSATPVLALMVGLAVGIDYALFIANRSRRLMLNDGKDAYSAAGQAVGTAGSAVVFAGLTVVVALGGLTLIGITFLTTMALVAAVTVALAVLVALTLLPALLGFIGEALASPRAREKARADAGETTFATKYVRGVISHRGPVTAVIVAVLLVLAIPAASMSFGMPSGSTANLDTDERQAHDAIAANFGEGYNAPLLTVTKAADGKEIDPIDLPLMALELRDVEGVETAQPMGLSEDRTVAIVSVIPEHGPEAEETTALVHELRDTGTEVVEVDAASFGVAGLTAVNIDISEKLADVLPIYITIIVVLSLLILLVVFRSVLIPIKATVGFLLSIGATFGIVTAVFQWGWAKELFGFDTTGPILSFLPIMVTGILYGLAMDYEMFLVTSMRQAHVQGYEGDEAIVEGFSRSSRVVVAAATIMVSVFAGFIFSGDPMVKQLGTALALGILIDAFVVRLTLVPAIMSFLGKAAWWLPSWLNKILPNLDVEGHALNEYLEREQAGDEAGELGSRVSP